jgi:hypothetical protein
MHHLHRHCRKLTSGKDMTAAASFDTPGKWYPKLTCKEDEDLEMALQARLPLYDSNLYMSVMFLKSSLYLEVTQRVEFHCCTSSRIRYCTMLVPCIANPIRSPQCVKHSPIPTVGLSGNFRTNSFKNSLLAMTIWKG